MDLYEQSLLFLVPARSRRGLVAPLLKGDHVSRFGVVGEVGLGHVFALFLHLREEAADFNCGIVANVDDLVFQFCVRPGHFEQLNAAEQHLGGLSQGVAESREGFHHDL